MFGGHVQGVVPVSSPKAVNIVATDLIKSGQLLNQKMFQYGSGINIIVLCAQQISLPGIPQGIDLCSSV